MKFSLFMCAGLAAATTYQNVLTDIKTIRSDLTTLNKSINAFQAGLDLADALAILSNSNTLNNDIKQGASDANASPNFGNKGSNAIATAVLNLEKPIFSTLNNLISKKNEFSHGILYVVSLDPIVLNTLQTLKNSTDAFGAAVTPKLTKGLQSVAPTIIAQIDAAFNKAIAAYSS